MLEAEVTRCIFAKPTSKSTLKAFLLDILSVQLVNCEFGIEGLKTENVVRCKDCKAHRCDCDFMGSSLPDWVENTRQVWVNHSWNAETGNNEPNEPILTLENN